MSTLAGVISVEVASFKSTFRYFSQYQRNKIIRTFKNYSKYYNVPLTIAIRPTVNSTEIEVLQEIGKSGCPHCYLRIFGHDECAGMDSMGVHEEID